MDLVDEAMRRLAPSMGQLGITAAQFGMDKAVELLRDGGAKLTPTAGSTGWLDHMKRWVGSKRISFIGPSGAGKTTLLTRLSGEPAPDQTAMTRDKIEKVPTEIGRGWSFPGDPTHWNPEKRAKLQGTDLIVVVLAYGYLDTVGLDAFARPVGKGKKKAPKFSTFEDYWAHCLGEEIAWVREETKALEQHRIGANNCVFVVNKMDHWVEDFKDVGDYYESHREDINNFSQRVSLQGHPRILCCASDYNPILFEAPSGHFSRQASELSIISLRDMLAQL